MNEALFEHRKRQQEATRRGLGGLIDQLFVRPPTEAEKAAAEARRAFERTDYARGGRIPLERMQPPHVNTTYPARQERLNRIQPADSSTPGGSSGMLASTDPSPKEDHMHPISRSWGSSHLVRALFDQGKNWITASGETVAVEDMRLDHILNTLLMLERCAEDFPFDAEDLQDQTLYKALYDRLCGALTGLDKPAPVLAAEAARRPLTTPLSRSWHVTADSIRSLLDAAQPSPGRLAKKVVLDYTDADGERSERTVEVYGIQDKRGEFAVAPYLVGKNVAKGEMRTYRLDRINRARLATGY